MTCYDCTFRADARCAVHRVIPPAGTCRDGVPVEPPCLPLVYDEGLSRGPRACYCGRRVTGRCDAPTATADECPMPQEGSYRCATYRREAVQALERFEASVERLTAFVRGEDETR